MFALTLLALTPAAPAPLPRRERDLPSQSQLIDELSRLGVEVRGVEADGRPGVWKIDVAWHFALEMGRRSQLVTVVEVVRLPAASARGALAELRDHRRRPPREGYWGREATK